MFLDDDVIPGPECIRRLLTALTRWPAFAAVAADYLGESQGRVHSGHVGMGATLFRRSALERIRFRNTADRCECQCCCDDLRALGLNVGYVPTAHAEHRNADRPREDHRQAKPPSCVLPCHRLAPRIVVAFDSNHLSLFRKVFLPSLRGANNDEPVTAVAYGLSRDQQEALATEENVEILAFPDNGINPSLRRLKGFEIALQRWPTQTPVAYWDARDVKFQTSVAPIWQFVRENPDKMLVVHEPISHPENRAVAEWTLSILEPHFRRQVFGLLSQRPFLNAGFAAGTAEALLHYLRESQRLRAEGTLRGSTDWGDQTTFNLYCHLNPQRWKAIDSGWNFCLCHRHLGRDYHVTSPDRQGRFLVRHANGETVPVVHGNAGSMGQLVAQIASDEVRHYLGCSRMTPSACSRIHRGPTECPATFETSLGSVVLDRPHHPKSAGIGAFCGIISRTSSTTHEAWNIGEMTPTVNPLFSVKDESFIFLVDPHRSVPNRFPVPFLAPLGGIPEHIKKSKIVWLETAHLA